MSPEVISDANMAPYSIFGLKTLRGIHIKHTKYLHQKINIDFIKEILLIIAFK